MKTNKLQLFITFFKIGLFTFGGGYAMVPVISEEIAHKKKWITDDDILEIVAIAESTPGPIAINMATFVGWRASGLAGAALATFGTVLPSFLIIFTISGILDAFQGLKPLQYAFFGIRAGVLALLIKALWTMYKKCPKGAVSYIVMAGSFIAAAFLKIDLIIIIICCAAFGLISSFILKRRAGK